MRRRRHRGLTAARPPSAHSTTLSGVIEDARNLAVRVHADQIDRDGDPHLLHVERVAALVDERTRQHPLHRAAVAVALLHDTVEADRGVTLESLAGDGFRPEVVAAVELLSRGRGVPYMAHVRRIAEADGTGGDLARIVKAADLDDNAARSRRLAEPSRLQRYLRGSRVLARAERQRAAAAGANS